MTRSRTIDFPAGTARAIILAREDGAMDANEYLLECMVRERLDARRARAWQAGLAATALRARAAGRWRSALGLALIRLGRAVAGEPARRARHA
jgi:hypothetical protein